MYRCARSRINHRCIRTIINITFIIMIIVLFDYNSLRIVYLFCVDERSIDRSRRSSERIDIFKTGSRVVFVVIVFFSFSILFYNTIRLFIYLFCFFFLLYVYLCWIVVNVFSLAPRIVRTQTTTTTTTTHEKRSFDRSRTFEFDRVWSKSFRLF